MAEIQNNELLIEGETHSETEAHSGPHIPTIQGETVYGAISNTVITTFFFMLIIIGVALRARYVLKHDKDSKLKLFFLTFIQFADNFLRDSFEDKKLAREFFPLIVGFFCIILFGNFFGLVIDWFGSSVSETLFYYLRPMHSDVNTTLVLSLITLYTLLFVQVRANGAGKTLKGYLFNFTGNSIAEKCVNVFVGLLHFIGLPITALSLSLRLFGNIFAGVVLLGVLTFLLATVSHSLFEVGRLFTLPFWFFEVFVATVQAIVFSSLMVAYFKQAGEAHH